ncbi:hypothetical protein [Halalkalibacillus halophilus]|uniref:hypothetical protein n=1 Tax=Halalkalibacillus halophilus TaxID=392827 RepID=UPI00047FDD29|nr:hypothetical protein [Halalkalibacillus halophilus]
MKLRSKTTIITLLSILTITLIALWGIGYIGIWINGMQHVASSDNGYRSYVEQVEGEHSVEIDLLNFNSNEGKVLFEEGDHKIYVSDVSLQNGSGYQINFRSKGTYGLDGAYLLSAVEHSSSPSIEAKVRGKYNGETYRLNPANVSSVKHEGDEFGFYLFPIDSDFEIDLGVDSTMEVVISDLQLNLWLRNNHLNF